MTDVVLLGMGGSSLAPEVFRRSSPPAAGRAARCTCSTPPSRSRCSGTRRGDRRRDDAVHRLLEVGRDDRAERAARVLPRPAARPGALRRDHRPGHVDVPAGDATRASATCSSPTPRSAAATRRSRRSASCRPRWPASTSGPCSRARRWRPENCELPEGNSGLWLGAALGELALHGRDKLTFVVDPPLGSFGVWAEQLVAESTGKQGRGILPIADEPLGRPGGLRERPRVPAPARRRRARPAPRRGGQGARGRRAPDDHAHRGGGERPRAGSSSSPSSPPRWPAGRWGSTRSTSPTSRRRRTTRPRCSRRARPQGLEDGSLAELLDGLAPPATSRSWATCPTTTRSTRRSPGCARR